MSHDMPLKGLKVIDFTIAMAGPLASQRLGDMGAEVIKVESMSGDLTRFFFLQDLKMGADTTCFLALNRNKKSIAIDLKQPAGRDVVYDLVRDAEVVMQNFRPGVAARLGIAYDDIRRINPSIIYLSISGYGEDGPMCDAPGQDLLVQSFSGMTFSSGVAGGAPHPAPTYFVDTCASHMATEAVLAALVQKARTGEGQHVKTNLLNAALEAQSQEVLTYLQTRKVARRTRAPYASAWLDPPYGLYRTQDSWLALPQNDMQVLARLVGSDELAAHLDEKPDPEHHRAMDEWRSVCYELLAAALTRKTTAQWIDLMTPEKIWCGAVQTIADLAAHPQARHHLSHFDHAEHGKVACVAPGIDFSSMRQAPMEPPPARLGEHTDELLGELGYAHTKLAELKAAEVIK